MLKPRWLRLNRFGLAVIVSLLVHLVVLFGGEVDLRPRPDLQRLEASLIRSAPDAKKGLPAKSDELPKPPVPKKKPKQVPDVPVIAPETPPQAPEKPPEPAQPEPEQVAEPEKEVPPPTPEPVSTVGSFWPKAGRITFALHMGEKRFQMGKSVHEWRISEDNHYEISATTEPTGVAAIPWFKPDVLIWNTRGKITERGLQPDSFAEKKLVRGTVAQADFDWVNKTVALSGNSVPLPDRAIDVLTLFYQLGYPGATEGGALPVTNGKKMHQYQFEFVGVEQLPLPFGMTWRTFHIRARYGENEVTEVWTAPEQFGLPVQVRVVDRKGVVYYLLATEILVAKNAMDKPTQ